VVGAPCEARVGGLFGAAYIRKRWILPVGPSDRPGLALLHVPMLALLKAKGVMEGCAFVRVGSNAEIYRDVKAGKIDAGPSDVSNLATPERSDCTCCPTGRCERARRLSYQLAYASDRAIRRNVTAWCGPWRLTENVPVHVLRRLMAGVSGARSACARRASACARRLDYIQSTQPTPEVRKRQRSASTICRRCMSRLVCKKSVLPIELIADLSLARDAMRLI